MASSDEEVDYMSDAFLQSICGKEDIRPGLLKSHAQKHAHKKEIIKRQCDEKNRTRNPSMKEKELASREDGLSKPIDSDNKGFQMLQKLGFKPGSGLGKSGEGRIEPVPVEVKADRQGLGRKSSLEEIARLRAKYRAEAKEKTLNINDYRMRKAEEAAERKASLDLTKCQRVCWELDTKELIDEPAETWFWPINKLPKISDEDLDEEHEPEDEDEVEQSSSIHKEDKAENDEENEVDGHFEDDAFSVQEKPKKRLSRGEVRRKRIEEALARGEKILSKKERRLAWAAKHPNPAPSEAGTYGNQEAGKNQGEGNTPKAISPSVSGEKGGKRGREHLTPVEAGNTKKTRLREGEVSSVPQRAPARSYSEKLSVEKLAIARSEHPDVKLTGAEANKIKGELSRRAIHGKDVRMSSCHLESGALVVGCANATTKEWLVKQVQEMSPFGGVTLQLAPARNLVKVVKVSTFVPSSIGATTKTDIMLGLKLQNGLDTDHWAVVGGKRNPDGQFLVMVIDDPSLQMLRSLAMRPYLGCERITFRLQVQEKLEMLTLYLRRTYLYCVWCGHSFEDEKDLQQECPGPLREDH